MTQIRIIASDSVALEEQARTVARDLYLRCRGGSRVLIDAYGTDAPGFADLPELPEDNLPSPETLADIRRGPGRFRVVRDDPALLDWVDCLERAGFTVIICAPLLTASLALMFATSTVQVVEVLDRRADLARVARMRAELEDRYQAIADGPFHARAFVEPSGLPVTTVPLDDDELRGTLIDRLAGALCIGTVHQSGLPARLAPDLAQSITRVFRDDGLVLPYVPAGCVERLAPTSEPDVFSTFDAELGELSELGEAIYSFAPFVRWAESHVPALIDVGFGLSGHGINSYAWSYTFRRPGLSFVAQAGRGLAYADLRRTATS